MFEPESGSRGGERRRASTVARAAIEAVFGAGNPAQRCRHQKVDNVLGYLPEQLKDQTKVAMQAAYRLPAAEVMGKLETQAAWLEQDYSSASAIPRTCQASRKEDLVSSGELARMGEALGSRRPAGSFSPEHFRQNAPVA
jgi:hypothetical protein